MNALVQSAPQLQSSIALYVSTNRSQALDALKGLTLERKLMEVRSTIELLDNESETLIKSGMTDIAILKMSQVVMLEEVQMLIERALLKEGL